MLEWSNDLLHRPIRSAVGTRPDEHQENDRCFDRVQNAWEHIADGVNSSANTYAMGLCELAASVVDSQSSSSMACEKLAMGGKVCSTSPIPCTSSIIHFSFLAVRLRFPNHLVLCIDLFAVHQISPKMGKSDNRESTDPSTYTSYYQKFERERFPSGQDAWVKRAREVAEILAIDAARRDIENKAPQAEIDLLKAAGLLKALGPKEFGGGGESWETGYKLIREVAKGDGSIGMLLGYHLLWSTTANVVGTEDQATAIQQVIIENNFYIGGAVNPRDSDLKITSDGDNLVFNGFKNFNTGGYVSDLTVLEGVLSGTEDHIFTLVKTEQPGIQFQHNWDNIGMRLTESGSVRIENIVVPWGDALGWDPKTKRPIPEVLGVPFASMLLPTIQLVFSNFYVGVAQGALNAASKYTATSTRAWPYGGDNKEKVLRRVLHFGALRSIRCASRGRRRSR